MSKVVSLNEYRSEKVKIFAGRERGGLVAKLIKEKHGKNVQIKVPEDVVYINTHFRVGFNKILPSVNFPKI